MKSKFFMIGALLLLLALALAACGGTQPAPTEASEAVQPTPEPCPTAAPCPECPECPAPVVENVPFEEAWANSPHNAAEDEAFTHWNDEGEVPANCAKCHSTPGYLDFLGEDGSEFGVVDAAAPLGTTVQCIACHNQTAATLQSVTFPSGVELTGLVESERCAMCHQGRASGVTVNSAIEEAGLTESPDEVTDQLRFINIHYYAAAATLYGSEAIGGYQYEGKVYDPKFQHVENYDTCASCHDQHTLEVRIDECSTCHTGVASVEDLQNIRMVGSLSDYDGDGDLEEGIAAEIHGLEEMALTAIQSYASEVAGTAIVYDSARYPYWFGDANANGTVDEGEEAFASWTPRLLKAAYNYQVAHKDPGGFAHNGKYIIQLLYDSIEDINTQLSTPVDLSAASRIDPGHFAGTEEAFRHWDEEGTVPGSCTKCHAGTGLPFFLEHGVTIAMEPTNALNCSTCHDDLSTFTRYQVTEVTFPSGATVGFEDTDPNLCINCHQGRESTVSVNAAINRAGVGPNEVSEALSFRNPHYFAAGATLFGSEVQGAYQYEGQDYVGRFMHVEAFNTCVECHNTHQLTVNAEQCSACHGSAEYETFRAPAGDATDYDGDGDTSEGYAGEIETMQSTLFEALQTYANNTEGAAGIVYSPTSYPYFFTDTNDNGELDPDEANFGNRYTTWTPTLLRAAYNYTWVAKDPGAFAHNADYIMQILFDSINAIGGSTQGMTRPTTPAQ